MFSNPKDYPFSSLIVMNYCTTVVCGWKIGFKHFGNYLNNGGETPHSRVKDHNFSEELFIQRNTS